MFHLTALDLGSRLKHSVGYIHTYIHAFIHAYIYAYNTCIHINMQQYTYAYATREQYIYALYIEDNICLCVDESTQGALKNSQCSPIIGRKSRKCSAKVHCTTDGHNIELDAGSARALPWARIGGIVLRALQFVSIEPGQKPNS